MKLERGWVMGHKICKHNVRADKCSQCFNERQIPVDAYFQARAEEAGERGIRNPKRKTPEPYLSGYRAGWNDGLDELLRKIPDVFSYADLKEAINLLKRDNEHYYSKEWKDEMIQDQG